MDLVIVLLEFNSWAINSAKTTILQTLLPRLRVAKVSSPLSASVSLIVKNTVHTSHYRLVKIIKWICLPLKIGYFQWA